MREILFRGKRIDNGEWEMSKYPYGTMFCGVVEHDFIIETVGQYTDMKDKNGNKIFEGDIVRWKECDRWAPDDGVVSGYVLYVDGQWLIQRPNIRSYLWRVHSLCEIIGNIHDNLELIGGDE